MKKSARVVLITIMIIGLSFSISNFMHVEVKAQAPEKNGTWIECPDGSYRCGGEGKECFIKWEA